MQQSAATSVASQQAHAAHRSASANLASTLGWLSLGLGAAALLMPHTIARLAGASSRNSLLRAIGARELLSGAGILLRPDKPGWLWSRVVGDAMDLSLMALAGRARGSPRSGAISGVMSAALAGITVLDLLAAYESTRRLHSTAAPAKKHANRDADRGTVHVSKTLDVNSSPEACYRFWRDISNFPRFMQHVESIETIDATRSRWRVRGPLKQHLTWESELTSDVPGQQLGWRTRSGSEMAHAGTVRFSPAPGHRGTRIAVDFQYHAPLGKTGLMLTRLLGDVLGEDPDQQVSDDLRRFKQLIETGEIPTTIGQPAGQRSALGRFIHKGAAG